MIEYRTGDLFLQRDLRALAHGCNCAGAMGAGIAVGFKGRWPAMYRAYRERCADGSFSPGDVFVWEGPEVTVFNLGTQASWRVGATMDAVERAVLRMVAEAEVRGVEAVGMPRIAAGLGGLAWPDVDELLASVADRTIVRLVVVTQVAPGPRRR